MDAIFISPDDINHPETGADSRSSGIMKKAQPVFVEGRRYLLRVLLDKVSSSLTGLCIDDGIDNGGKVGKRIDGFELARLYERAG
ncbi:hypothetical protein HFO97_27000 [Rhizobium leguminosarum]|uniref:hypothetical protein n=1 Tax=Rhizobium leguminosarum TaxID=384 RepID=UPI001C975D2C|nr:hypothetical protein [Rhizobium leguminosarum]MBY5363534.1 hypothetical protein [Rhizobium leguminosarum]